MAVPIVVAGLSAPAAEAAPSPDLVISQVYGGGGNTGATYRNDFVEIFNRGSAAVNVGGWSVQYASATGTGNFGSTAAQLTPLPAVSIPAGGYLLVAEAGSGDAPPLPTPDVTDDTPINLSGSAGKVALVDQASALGCNGGSTPCTSTQLAHVHDLVGYGGANFAEGTPAPGLSNTTAAIRARGGCQDTDSNSADFAAGAPQPRNSAAPLHHCDAPMVTATSPAAGETGVEQDADQSVTFSEPVDVTSDWLTLSCTDSGSHALSYSGGPTTFTANPATDLASSETCTATVHADLVTDRDPTPHHPDADHSWTFTVAGRPDVVHDIQGAAHISPEVGQPVDRVAGIVTATVGNGFWMQDPVPDADPATSEGIFVFTNAAPAVSVGDSVRVSGKVAEFRPGGSTTANLTTTEITGPTVRVLSSGNPLPAATVIGAGGRTPPGSVIEDDAADVETSGTFDPQQDGIDFWESLEGMRIQLNDAVATGPTSSFGEISVVGDDGAYASPRTVRGGVVVSADDFNPERILTDDAIVPAPQVNVGDHFSGPLVGVVDYSFGTFKLELTTPVTRVDGGLVRETTTSAAGDELSAATFNVENLDPNDGPDKFNRLAELIVHNMQAPDLISLEEVQDNNGAVNDGVVDASQTYATLIDAIQQAGGPTYAYRQIDPVDDKDGGEGGGNIRVGFLFRTDVGLSFIDRPGGTSTSATTVVAAADGTPQLSASPGRIDPANSAWTSSRKPLAGEFTFRGRHLFAVANHFNSKGGDEPLFGHRQPPVRSSEVQRHQQATLVHDFVDDILSIDPHADVLVMGDLNDFEFSDTLSILKGSTLHDLVETLPKAERYSYVYEGNSQVLDHVLVSDHLLADKPAVDVVHVNAEFFDQASDHDPTVVRIPFQSAPVVSAGGDYTVGEGGTVALEASATDAEGDPVTLAWDLDGDGAFDDATGPSATFDASRIDGPAQRTVSVQATDAYGASSTASAVVHVTNVAPTLTGLTAGPHASCGGASAITVTWQDPAPADTVVVDVDWGDGTIGSLPATGTTLTASHAYATAGPHLVTVTVRDDDGGSTAPAWATAVVDYTVLGGGLMAPFADGAATANAGSTVPVKVAFAACDGSRPAGLAPQLQITAAGGGPVLASGDLRWDGAKYVAQLDTSRLPGSGTYAVVVTVPSTGQRVTGSLRLR